MERNDPGRRTHAMDLYAQPQRLVRIGRRRRLNVLLSGKGRSRSSWRPGAGSSTIDWGYVPAGAIPRLSRALLRSAPDGGSATPGRRRRTTGRIGRRPARAALRRASISGGPNVIAGHSWAKLRTGGGCSAYRTRARSRMGARSTAAATDSATVSTGCGAKLCRQLAGGAPPVSPQRRRLPARRPGRGLPSYARARSAGRPQLTRPSNAAFLRLGLRPSSGDDRFEGSSLDGAAAAELEAGETAALGKSLLIVLTAGRPPFEWGQRPGERGHRELVARLATRNVARLVGRGGEAGTLPDVGHMIPGERPDAGGKLRSER